MNTIRYLLLCLTLSGAVFAADVPANSATDAALATAIRVTTEAAMAKVTATAAPTPIAPPVAPQAVAPAAPKDAAPAWTTTRDSFLAFALDKAKSYTGKAEEAVSKAVDVASTEAPVLFKEWITWRIWYHALHVVLPLLMIAVCMLVAYLANRKARWDYGPDNLRAVLTIVGWTLSIIFSVFWFFSALVNDPPNTRDREQGHLYSLVQVCAAPRVYTIEQVAHLFGK